MDDHNIINPVRRWLESIVIELNLCPFASGALSSERVRFVSSSATLESKLLEHLESELKYLDKHRAVETTLLIHSQVLQDFAAYNAFLDLADALLRETDREGVYQVASFHPDYQFQGTERDDAENYTNRSPYPLLHILREESLSQAIDAHPDVGSIPEKNIQRMNTLGRDHMVSLLRACR